MKTFVHKHCVAFALLGLLTLPVWAQLPKRDLTVEVRQIEEGREGGSSYSAGSADPTVWEPQMVQVRNRLVTAYQDMMNMPV